MSNEKTGLTIPDKQLEVARKLNDKVSAVIGHAAMQGFEKAYQIATAIEDLRKLLTPEYMKPILALQGNKLGFRTDKDTSGGYPEEIVKNCLIEAVLTGFEPWGNQFNIIAGSMYGTKEGFGAALNKIPGLKWDIVPTLPRVNAAKDGAAVVMKINWTYGGAPQTKEIEFAVRMNQYATVDSAIGKATRKARAWLFNTINGTEIGEGDVQDADFKVVSSNPTKSKDQIEQERMESLIKAASTIESLQKLMPDVPLELMEVYKLRESELAKK